MPVETILKQPGEVLRRPVAFPALASLTGIASTQVEARGLVAQQAALVVTAEFASGAAVIVLSGGTDGETYQVAVLGNGPEGAQAQADIEVVVLEGGWVMPDGGAPYLTIAEFVARFGLPEVVAMTDAVGDGRIDRPMLVAALVDAQAVADAHIAARYAVPLGAVPLVVKKIVADLARAALYPRGAPDGVADQAKLSMRMLERIQSGAMPIPAEVPPQEAASDNPILIAPGRRAYPDGLAGY